MDNWRELSLNAILRPPRDPNAPLQEVTCTMFDEQSDLIWVGDSTGFLASYADTSMVPYTRFRAHMGPIQQLISHHKGVLSTDGRTLRLTNRRGLAVFNWSSAEYPELKDIHRMALTGPNELLVATSAGLVKFDTAKSLVVSVLPYTPNVLLMESNKRHVAIGREDGAVDIYEVRTNTIVITFETNSSTLSDMDLKEQTLVTCGVTRRHNGYSSDTIVNVFDLRTLRSVAPIPFPAGAYCVRLHPKLPSVCLITSKAGLMQCVDMFDTARASVFQIDVGPQILSFEVSSTGDFLSIVDAFSFHHLWAHNPEHSTMSNRAPLESGTPPEVSHNPVDVDDDMPLNKIGMSYYKETLLSAWPPQMVFKSAGTVSKPIDQSIIESATQVAPGIFRAPYDKDKHGRRNLAKKYVPVGGSGSAGKFLSSKVAPKRTSNKTKGDDDVFEYKTEEPNRVPNAFKKLKIMYSKFGIDDFDFDFYNQTNFSGLESHVDNSYTNSFLQLYRFVPEMFNFAVGNLAIENLEPSSILTELGYLYDMLFKASGKHYRATNFQHTLSSLSEASKMGLLESDGNTDGTKAIPNLVDRSHWFNLFLLETLKNDELKSKEQVGLRPTFETSFGIEFQRQRTRIFSNETRTEMATRSLLDIISPYDPIARPVLPTSVIDYIEFAMNRVEQAEVQDPSSRFVIPESRRQTAVSLPPVISCNLILSPDDKRSIRSTSQWLKAKFYAAWSDKGYYLSTNVKHMASMREYVQEYELVGFVAEIAGDSEKDPHLVTFVQVFDEESGNKNWYMFNDFLVIPIPEEEALDVTYWWKTPVTLVYRDTSTPLTFDVNAWKNGLNDEILYRDHFAAGTRESKRIEYELLTREEAPQHGSLVAIDTEFVTIEEEHFELKSTGVRSLLKPSNQALARVSVLRGDDGEKFGVPFIDDWVVVKEKIHDYLTSYSGIEHGDLDPSVSNKALVTRQVVYRKLWLLLNLGCVFVGHGLTKDFRTINISVPKSQVRDTAVFFYKGQRILSLRFLAYIVLERKVQEGNHDSIEDAHTALLLYKKYQEFKEAGNFDEVLDYIYQEGQMMKFKPPGED